MLRWGEGRPSSEANPGVRSMVPTPRASILLRSFSVNSRQPRGLKNRWSFAERETGHGVPRRDEVENSGRLCSI